MAGMSDYPRLLQTVLDTTDVRGLAEFYGQLLGWSYRPGAEPPTDGTPDDADWLTISDADNRQRLAFQQTDALPRSTWPDAAVPQQLHLDLMVGDVAALEHQRERALALGATQIFDRSDDPDEPLYVFADPAGHPFCVFVG